MALAAMLVAPRLLLASGLRLNGSPSMPMGLYWLHAGAFPDRRGLIVFACPDAAAGAYLRRWDPGEITDGSCPGNMKPLVKIAAALPGDRVDLTAQGIRVNGSPLMVASAPQRYSSTVPRHAIPGLPYGTYIVPQGRVWLYAPEWYSFDSRYYGPLPVIGVGVPLLVHRVPIRTSPPPSP